MKKKVRSVDEKWHRRSANSASITSQSETSGCGHATFGFRRAPSCSCSMNVVVQVGKQRLYKPRDCHQVLTSSRTVRQRQNDDLRFCVPCEKCEWWGRRERAPVNFLKESFADEETCRDWYRVEDVGRWLDQRVAILADQPLCSDELNDQLSSLLCQLISSTSSSFSRSLQQRWPLDRARLRTWWSTNTLSAPGPAVAVFEIWYCACVKISPRVWGILGDDVLFEPLSSYRGV